MPSAARAALLRAAAEREVRHPRWKQVRRVVWFSRGGRLEGGDGLFETI